MISAGMMSFIIGLFLFAIGACVGSFLNVVIDRIPHGLSVLTPRSHCVHCERVIEKKYLIPIVSFFYLRGRCAYCREGIPKSIPLVEILAGLGTIILVAHAMPQGLMGFVTIPWRQWDVIPVMAQVALPLWIFYTGLALSFIDFEHRILPDRITLWGMPVGLAIASFVPNIGLVQGILGIVLGYGGLRLLAFLYEKIRKREGIGLGDVKYLGLIGAALGPWGVVFALFIASFLGSVVGIGLGMVNRQGFSQTLPFGPFLAVGALCAWFFIA